MTTFITVEDISQRSLQIDDVLASLRAGSPGGFLAALASLLAPIETTNVLDRAVQARLARHLLGGAPLNRALAAIDEGRVFMAPQVLLVSMKTALVLANETHTGPIPSWAVLNIIFAHVALLGTVDEDPDTKWHGFPAEISLEVVRNQNFNRSHPLANVIARYWRLWQELPAECGVPTGERPADHFLMETQCSPEQLALFGLWCWASAALGRTLLPPDEVDQIPIDSDAKQKAIELTASTVDELRVAAAQESIRDGIPWAFLAFRRRPLAKMGDGSLLVLSPRFLGDRVFGDAMFWELTDRANRMDAGTPNGPHWQAFRNLHAQCVERYAEEVLESWRPTDHEEKRMFTEEDMNAAWGKGVRVSDVALEYGWAWLVVEIVSRRFAYGAATGGDPSTLDTEIALAVEAKAEQLDSTIKKLRDEEVVNLTGRQPQHAVRFYPVVLVAHGFPTNPLTLSAIRQSLTDGDLLQGDDTAPLELLDLEELDLLDAVREQTNLSAVQILRDKHASAFISASVMDYVMIDRALEPELPRRLSSLYEKARAAAIGASNDPSFSRRANQEGAQPA